MATRLTEVKTHFASGLFGEHQENSPALSQQISTAVTLSASSPGRGPPVLVQYVGIPSSCRPSMRNILIGASCELFRRNRMSQNLARSILQLKTLLNKYQLFVLADLPTYRRLKCKKSLPTGIRSCSTVVSRLLLLRVPEVPGSNLVLETAYSQILQGYPQTLQANALNQPATASFHTLYNSL